MEMEVDTRIYSMEMKEKIFINIWLEIVVDIYVILSLRSMVGKIYKQNWKNGFEA